MLKKSKEQETRFWKDGTTATTLLSAVLFGLTGYSMEHRAVLRPKRWLFFRIFRRNERVLQRKKNVGHAVAGADSMAATGHLPELSKQV